jgi:hypothetical protein
MLDAGVFNTPPWFAGKRLVYRTLVLSVSNEGVDISAPTYPSLVGVGKTWCSH